MSIFFSLAYLSSFRLFGFGVDAYVQVELEPFMWKTIDPIRAPGSFSTHLHMHAGSSALTATTKGTDDLLKGCTNADNPNDLSVYWIPALINKHTNVILKPIRFGAYYFNIVPGLTHPFPKDLKLVAGNALNQDKDGVDRLGAAPHWLCENYRGHGFSEKRDVNAQNTSDTESGIDADITAQDGSKPNAAFPGTKCPGVLHLLLYFPNCVDPKDLTKYTYATGSGKFDITGCPQGMINVPQLRLSVRWKTGDLVPAEDLVLSSGNEYSTHGDFMNAWHPVAAENMLQATAKLSTHRKEYVEGPLKAHHCVPEDSEPNEGLSCYTGPPPGLQKRDVESTGLKSDLHRSTASRRRKFPSKQHRMHRIAHSHPPVNGTSSRTTVTTALPTASAVASQNQRRCLGPSVSGLH